MADTNFYETLDLKYGEIGIAMQKIDRMNPGSVAFTIPILTPNMNNSTVVKNKVIQRDKSNLMNTEPGSVDVSDVEVSNVIYITIPKELCALPNAVYDVEGKVKLNGTYEMDGTGNTSIDGNIGINASTLDNKGSIDITSLSLSASSGSISENEGAIGSFSISNARASGTGDISGNGSVKGSFDLTGKTSYDGSGKIEIDGTLKGTLTAKLNKDNRYIPANSKWLILFIGGDITLPRVIARLPD